MPHIVPKMILAGGLLASVLLICACSQNAAPIENKGVYSYNKRGSGEGYLPGGGAPLYSFNSPAAPQSAPKSNATVQSAQVASIGVHDLAALAPAAGAQPQPKPQPKIQVQADTSTSATPVNRWTKQPHFEDDADDVPAAAPVTIMPAKPKAAAPVKQAKAERAATFMWPVAAHKIISAFGPKGGGKSNDGINIASKEGEPVWASAGGEVVYVGNELQGYGNMVLIKHAGNKTTAYAHLGRATVDKYDQVKQGDIIGYVGSTGNVKSPQLHFAIRSGKDPVDPQKYLSRSVASN